MFCISTFITIFAENFAYAIGLSKTGTFPKLAYHYPYAVYIQVFYDRAFAIDERT